MAFKHGFKAWSERVSEHQRKSLGLNSHDPLNPYTLADHLGITILDFEAMPGLDSDVARVLKAEKKTWSAITVSHAGKTGIVLNPYHSKPRTNSNLAHELSHYIIGHEPARVDVSEESFFILDSYNPDQEDEADWLAATLLLPRAVLLYIRKNKLSNQAASSHYGVSSQLLTFRLNKSGVDYQLGLKCQIKS